MSQLLNIDPQDPARETELPLPSFDGAHDSTPPDGENQDDQPDGGEIAPLRSVFNVWAAPVDRRAIGYMAFQKLGRRFSRVRIDPLPVAGKGHDLGWLCFAPQCEIDTWRADQPFATATLVAVERWLAGGWSGYGAAVAPEFSISTIWGELTATLHPRLLDVLQRRAAGGTLESVRNHLIP